MAKFDITLNHSNLKQLYVVTEISFFFLFFFLSEIVRDMTDILRQF